MPGSRDDYISDLSEGEILASILERTSLAENAEVGPGDDAAVLRVPSGSIIVTTDTLVHGPDFRLAWSNGYDLGWKAAAVNLADVAAMGGIPTALTVALALPGDLTRGFVEDMADGLREACAFLAPGCAVVGGDLTSSATLTIAVTALGEMQGSRPVLRSGAVVGDVIAIAGEMGQAAAGLRLLFERFCPDGTPISVDDASLSEAERQAIAAQLRPAPPIASGAIAARAGAHAMMDVSDGLALDARRLAKASGVSCQFSSALLGPDPVRALRGGEDHALLATFAPGAVPNGFRVIGEISEESDARVLLDGEPFEERGGWDPYADWSGGVG